MKRADLTPVRNEAFEQAKARETARVTAQIHDFHGGSGPDMDQIGGRACGTRFALSLRSNVMIDRHMARRLREFNPPEAFWFTYDEPAIVDALGHGVALLNLLDPNASHYSRMRNSVEELAERVTGMAYPSWRRLIAAVEMAKQTLERQGEAA